MTTRKEAKALGLGTYINDKPCIHGHTTGRRTSSGNCCECEKIRKNTTAYKDKFKVYIKEYQQGYFLSEKHIEHRKAYMRDYYRTHKGAKK